MNDRSFAEITVKQTGCFTLKSGDAVVRDCFPGMDGSPIRPLNVKVVGGAGVTTIVYSLEQGTIELCIACADDAWFIDSRLRGMPEGPRFFDLIHAAQLEGADRMYRQGQGICGPSGLELIQPFEAKLKSMNSHGLMAIGGQKEFMFLFPLTHDRFVSRFDLHFILREDCRRLLSFGYRLEQINATDISLPRLCVTADADLGKGLRRSALAIRDAAPRRAPKPPLFHWDSWYYHYHTFSHAHLREFLAGLRMADPRIPFQYILIDAGFHSGLGDWLSPGHRYPDGVKAACRDIQDAGYIPGIWFSPHMVGDTSTLCAQHPEWLLRRKDGNLIVQGRMYDGRTDLGMNDHEQYVLDTSHPGAQEYLRTVLREYKSWGIRMIKADFMYWGMHAADSTAWHNPGKTAVEHLVDLVKLMREEIADGYLLACIAPFLPFVGYADAMRIAADVRSDWPASTDNPYSGGYANMVTEIIGGNYFNNIFWQNDPDVLILRTFHTHLCDHEVEALTLLQGLSGGVVCTSDPVQRLSAERLELLRFVQPHEPVTPVFPFLNSFRKEIVLTHNLGGGRHIIFLLNPATEPLVCRYTLSELIGVKQGHIYHHSGKTCSGTPEQTINVTLGGHSARLFLVSTERTFQKPVRNVWKW